MKSLYKGNDIADLIENQNEVQNHDRGDSILKEEFEKALVGSKSKSSTTSRSNRSTAPKESIATELGQIDRQ